MTKGYHHAKPGDTTKICSQCGIEKPLYCFYPDGRGIVKHSSQCSLCINPLKSENYIQRPLPLIKTCNKCGKVKNIDEFSRDKSRNSGYHKNCKECANEIRRQWDQKNLERRRERDRLHYHAHPEAYQTHWRNRKALKRKVMGSYTIKQIREQYARQNGLCYYCRHAVKWGMHHVDHTFPLSRVAGTDIPANDIAYLVMACGPCNMSKGNKFPWEWPEGGRLL